MRNLKAIAEKLRRGDVDVAFKEAQPLVKTDDELLRLEVVEIAKQAMLSHLKHGDIITTRKIQKLFSVSDEMFDDTVLQAVLSSFRDSDFSTVKELRAELPISKRVVGDLLTYCSTWGDTRKCLLMEEVLA